MTRAADAEHKVESAQRRFFGVLSVVLTVVVIGVTLAVLLLVQQVRDAERRDAVANAKHRQRNELIHGCVNAKIDRLRLDIAELMKNPHGGFAGDDGIRCPPIQP